MKIQAKIGFTYGGKWRKPGAVFEAADKEARLLNVIGKAIYFVEPVEEPDEPVEKTDEQTGEDKPKRGKRK